MPIEQPEDGFDLDGLEPWRESVLLAADAVGLIELPSTRFIELSPRAMEMVGAERTTGLECLAGDERGDAAAIVRAATAGAIAGSESPRRSWRWPDGSVGEVTFRSRSIRLDTGTFGVWVAHKIVRADVDPMLCPPDGAVEHPAGEWSRPLSGVAILDTRWRVREGMGESQELREVLGDGVAAATHPDDMARLLFAFAGATMLVDATAQVRLLSRGRHATVDLDVTRPGDGSWRLEIAPTDRAADQSTGERTRELERSLERIARELHGAGVVTGSAPDGDVLGFPGVLELPERQREIVVRLAGGERVGTIAAKMYLSPNTVRNHLSVVFGKFGVHSQEQLLALLRGDGGDDPPSAW
jgi:DNA-binding CsgD family transcriptional regulator